jgi:hypothetical protein
MFAHVCQVAGYWFGTGLMQSIVYANASGYRVFNADNCDQLSQDGLQSALNHIVAKCAIRENILKSADSVEAMLRLIEPDFSPYVGMGLSARGSKSSKKTMGV